MSTATMTTKSAFGKLHKHAERIKNDEHQTAGSMSIGDAWAQGDIALVLLESVPRGAKREAKPDLQLAPGNTQGSRHCLETLDGLTVYQHAAPTPLDGPILEAPHGLRVNHPEHGDVSFGPGIYAVVYQRAFADELRRVQD